MVGEITETAKANRELVLGAYTGLLRGDIEGWWKIFDKDVELHEAEGLPYGHTYRGVDNVRAGR